MADRLSDIPDPGDRGMPRYSSRAFPRYRYVPGVHPHPHRDPAGHSYEPHPTLNRHAPWRVEEWRTLDDWLYGVDLFNAFYFWEAHEAWEGLWAAVARDSAPALMLQGLIQVAAALLKTHMQVLEGVRALSAEGLEKLCRVATAHPQMLGLDLAELGDRLVKYFSPVQRNELPIIGRDVPILHLS
jgi:uncharacterized protein